MIIIPPTGRNGHVEVARSSTGVGVRAPQFPDITCSRAVRDSHGRVADIGETEHIGEYAFGHIDFRIRSSELVVEE